MADSKEFAECPIGFTETAEAAENIAYRKRVQAQKRSVIEAREDLLELQDELGIIKAKVRAAGEVVGEKSRELLEVIDGQIMMDLQTDESSADAKGEGGDGESPEQEWRDIPVEALGHHGLLLRLRRKLIEADLSTIGAIADFTAADRRLIDIPGIGEAKAEKIESALEKFWAERNKQNMVGPEVTLKITPADDPVEPDAETDKPDSQGWREASVNDLEIHGLSKEIIKSLWDAQLTTLGELKAYLDSDYTFSDIVGIGQKEMVVIVDTFERFRETGEDAVTESASVPDTKC